MLDDLATHLDAAKLNDLLSRLDHRSTDTALAAEAELSMLWAISRVAHLKTEPGLLNSSHRPDALSDNLFASGPAVIEVRALSDHSFSGKEAMDRTANIVAGYADQLRKGAGRHLYLEFMDRNYWTTRFHRERCVDPDFELTSNVKQQLREWILAKDWPSPERIRITEGKTEVVVSWRPTTSKHFRVFSRMPPVAYDLEDNPVYKALRKKTRQVKGAAPGTLRCVFLVDAGCDLLRQLRPMSVVREIGGETVIRHALRKLSVDIVCVFSPYRERLSVFSAQSRILWKVTSYDRRTGVPIGEYDRLKALAGQLPRPRFEGYQARDLHVQGLFGPTARGWYLPTIVSTSAGGKMTIKLSARLVQECLAGRIDGAALQHHAFGKTNYFDAQLARGNTIRAVRFEGAGLDEDDDYLVFELDFDWAASPLKPAKSHG